jgi:hypothetical protein
MAPFCLLVPVIFTVLRFTPISCPQQEEPMAANPTGVLLAFLLILVLSGK